LFRIGVDGYYFGSLRPIHQDIEREFNLLQRAYWQKFVVGCGDGFYGLWCGVHLQINGIGVEETIGSRIFKGGHVVARPAGFKSRCSSRRRHGGTFPIVRVSARMIGIRHRRSVGGGWRGSAGASHAKRYRKSFDGACGTEKRDMEAVEATCGVRCGLCDAREVYLLRQSLDNQIGRLCPSLKSVGVEGPHARKCGLLSVEQGHAIPTHKR